MTKCRKSNAEVLKSGERVDTILVTGGAGFIGSWVVRHMVARQDALVVNLDKLTYAGNLDSLQRVIKNPLHVFVEGDIGNGDLVTSLLEEHRPRAVINLAAESHVDRSIDGPAAFLMTNVVGVFTLLEATRDYWKQLPPDQAERFRFLHVSTDEVYGSLGPTGAFTETSPYVPSSPYSASKASADHFVHAFHQTYGLPTLTTNCSNNFGPYQFPEKLLPLMILNAVEGKPLPVYGDGQNVRDWLFVKDHIRALQTVLACGIPGEMYNVGANCQRTNLQVVTAICETVDRLRPELPHRPSSSLICFVEDRPGHDRRYAIDARKIQSELGWQPRESFDTALERTVRWYLDHTDWVTSCSHRRERLGLH